MYTFMAVYMHFYRFIELMINYHTHPFNIIGFKKVVVSLAMEPCDRYVTIRRCSFDSAGVFRRTLNAERQIVCYTAVFRVVTPCSSPPRLWGGALRDDTKTAV